MDRRKRIISGTGWIPGNTSFRCSARITGFCFRGRDWQTKGAQPEGHSISEKLDARWCRGRIRHVGIAEIGVGSRRTFGQETAAFETSPPVGRSMRGSAGDV